METREIPQNEWPLLCSRLKREHGQSLVNLEVLTGQHKRELVGQPLADLSAKAAAQGETILIAVGDHWEGYRGHTIANPVRLRLVTEGGEEALVVEGADGSTTIVHFLPAD